MGITEVAVTVTFPVAANMANSAAFPNQAVVEGLPVAAGLPELDMVSDFLCNRGWIL
jgi:hypothetical protein